jgi:hypothetical protein
MKPKLQTVPFAEVRAHLPADTPGITPQQRHDQLLRRLISVYRRRMADF